MFKLYQKDQHDNRWRKAASEHIDCADWETFSANLINVILDRRVILTGEDTLRAHVCSLEAETILRKPWRKGAKRRTFRYLSENGKWLWKYQIRREDDGI